MTKAHQVASLQHTLRRFVSAEQGNIAVIFAIVAVPIISFLGAAIDYSRANNARTSMQSAADSAALMVSKDLASGVITADQVAAKAQAYFNALFTNRDTSSVALTTTYIAKDSKGASTVVVNGTASITTDFMRVVGFPSMALNTASTATWGGTRIRVAMALDVTGSMNDNNKLSAMQTSAKSLIDTLHGLAITADDVYVSVVPFAQMVNVGKTNKAATWIDWSDWDENYGNCSSYSYKTKSSCQSANRTWTPETHNNWTGCVTDRNQPYDTTSDPPTTTATSYTAVKYEQSGSDICPAQILPMTSLYSASNVLTVKAKVDELKASGGTNQPIGMAWAWQSLRGGNPLNAPAKDPNFLYNDVIILLSDGLNTIDRWPAYGNGTVQYDGQIDARQRLLCDNIKSKTSGRSPTVFTIQVNTSGDPESAVLKYCADAGQFFPISTSAGIDAAFKAIGTSLSKLRVSR
jgi:Flp pilus assembly protein TadG